MKASYVDHMGSDLTVVNAARVSFAKHKDVFDEKDGRLLQYLARHGHWTPFGHCQITLQEQVPIFVARQRFKHTVGFVYNEVSRRYIDDKPEFYTPDVWRKRAEDKKQGSSDEAVDIENFGTEFWLIGGNTVSAAYERFINYAERLYFDLLEHGVAPEQARMVLPQSMFTEYYVTGSLAAWARAYKLRSDSHAQKEIRDLAAQWDTLIRPLFPVSWDVLTKDTTV